MQAAGQLHLSTYISSLIDLDPPARRHEEPLQPKRNAQPSLKINYFAVQIFQEFVAIERGGDIDFKAWYKRRSGKLIKEVYQKPASKTKQGARKAYAYGKCWNKFVSCLRQYRKQQVPPRLAHLQSAVVYMQVAEESEQMPSDINGKLLVTYHDFLKKACTEAQKQEAKDERVAQLITENEAMMKKEAELAAENEALMEKEADLAADIAPQGAVTQKLPADPEEVEAVITAMQLAMSGDSGLSVAASKVLANQLVCLERSSLSFFTIMTIEAEIRSLEPVFSSIEDDSKILPHIMSIPSITYSIWGCFPALNQDFFSKRVLAPAYVKLMLSAYGVVLKNDPSGRSTEIGTVEEQFLNIYHHYKLVYPCLNSQSLWGEGHIIHQILAKIMSVGQDGAVFNDIEALKNARMIIDVGYISGDKQLILEEITKALADNRFVFYVPLLFALEKYVKQESV